MTDSKDHDAVVPEHDPFGVDPLAETTAGRGELPPEELRSFNTTGRLGPAGDIEAAQRAGGAGYRYLRDRSAGSLRRLVPWLAGGVLLVVFVLPAILR